MYVYIYTNVKNQSAVSKFYSTKIMKRQFQNITALAIILLGKNIHSSLRNRWFFSQWLFTKIIFWNLIPMFISLLVFVYKANGLNCYYCYLTSGCSDSFKSSNSDVYLAICYSNATACGVSF